MALHGSPIADFINLVQLEASGAQVSCTALGNEVSGFQAQVTVRDVVASYPFSNTLVVLQVTGRVLRAALEQCATYFAVLQRTEPSASTITLQSPRKRTITTIILMASSMPSTCDGRKVRV